MIYNINSSNELAHWGIKGMRWGVRRYQNADGSLTPAGKKRYGDDDDTGETKEETRARVLKSTNASEIYKHRDLLSTAELNERMNRIDTEARLSRMAESTRKSGMDKIDSVLKVARKVDEVYRFTSESSIGKQLSKKLFGDAADDTVTKYLDKDISKVSDKQLKKMLDRMRNDKNYNTLLKDLTDPNGASSSKNRNTIDDLSNLTDDQIKELRDRLKEVGE